MRTVSDYDEEMAQSHTAILNLQRSQTHPFKFQLNPTTVGPRCDKTCLQGFRESETLTNLSSYRQRPDTLSGLIWVQTVCKGYQQTTKVAPSMLNTKQLV